MCTLSSCQPVDCLSLSSKLTLWHSSILEHWISAFVFLLVGNTKRLMYEGVLKCHTCKLFTSEKRPYEYSLHCFQFVRLSRTAGRSLKLLPLEGSTMCWETWRSEKRICQWNSVHWYSSWLKRRATDRHSSVNGSCLWRGIIHTSLLFDVELHAFVTASVHKSPYTWVTNIVEGMVH